MAETEKKFFELFLWTIILVIICSMSCGMEKEMKRKEVLESTVRKGKDEMEKRRVAIDHFKKGENYLRDGDLAKAENEIKIAISLHDKHPVPHLLLGDIYCAKEDFQKALYEYERAEAMDKTKGLPHAKIGRVYIELGMDEKAIEAFKTAIELDPDIPGLHRELGNLYRRMGLEDDADREYGEAEGLLKSRSQYAVEETSKISGIKKRRGSEHLHPRVEKVLKLGDEFLKDGLLGLAIEEFKIAAQLAPNTVIVQQKLGDAYVRKGMLQEAIAQYERVRELRPDSPLGYLGLGVVHARMFDIDNAISSFEKGVSLDPEFAPLHFELAMAYMKEDMLDEAIYELEKTVELDTINPQPKEILDKVKKEKEAEEGFVAIQNGPFILKYNSKQDRSFIDYTLRLLQEAYQKLMIGMSYQPKKRMIVKIYHDLSEFQLAATTPQWFKGGVAATKDYKILLATPKRVRNIRKLPEVITHELTHVFTNLITFGNHPAWIHEGIALWEASQWDLEKEKILKWAISEDKLFGLGELENPFTLLKNPKRVNLAYAQAYTAVKFILDRYGRDKLLEILYEFSKGKNFDEAARRVLDMSMEEFEHKWPDFIGDTYG